MTRSEFNAYVRRLFCGTAYVEKTLEPGEAQIFTDCWLVEQKQLAKLGEVMEITSIFVDGERISINGKIRLTD